MPFCSPPVNSKIMGRIIIFIVLNGDIKVSLLRLLDGSTSFRFWNLESTPAFILSEQCGCSSILFVYLDGLNIMKLSLLSPSCNFYQDGNEFYYMKK